MSRTPLGDRPKRRRNITIDRDVDAETAARVGERGFSGEVERLLRGANAAMPAVRKAVMVLPADEARTRERMGLPSDDGGDSGGPG